MTSLPTFEGFYSALWERAPFPWQIRLAGEVVENGWPDLLDLPTGAGKTSSLDIALYALACAPGKMPRRTVLVVDRRIVVDQGADHARKILEAMRTAKSGPVAEIAAALRGLFHADAADDPFAVAVMRGGMPRDNDWARRPDQPVVGVSTIDQVGSRLLFRGYGVSSRSASIHAGLLGNDTLILLDEVHLAVPFAQTLAAISERHRPPVAGLPDRFAVVRMSATAGPIDPQWSVFRLGDEDRTHPVLLRRLAARKNARLRPVRVTGDDEAKKRAALADAAVTYALELQRQGASTVAIVVNRVDTARLAHRLLLREHHKNEESAVLITGRMRAIDRDRLVRRVLNKALGSRANREPHASLLVVATQCIEAGADFDFDGLVTECASLDALRQRFGRLDRQGERGVSQAVILGRSDAVGEKADDPVYGKSLAKTWAWLQTVAQEDTVDLGIVSSPAVEPHVELELIAPRLDAPVLLPAHLAAWGQTSPVPDFDPEVGLWLHGAQRPSVDVQVLWRSDLTIPDDPSEQDRVAAVARLSPRRPSTLESISVPLVAAQRWLSGHSSVAIADVPSGAAEGRDDRPERRQELRDRALRVVALCWRGDESKFVTPGEIRPGDVLVLPSTVGGIGGGSFDPDATEAVLDVGDVAQLRARGIASLLLNRAALAVWGVGDLAMECPGPENDERVADTRERVGEWIARWPSEQPDGLPTQAERDAVRNALSPSKRARVTTLDGDLFIGRKLSKYERLGAAETVDALSEDDDSSFRQVEVTLRDHSSHVRDVAEGFAEALGFGPELRRAVRVAGWLHDVGKADPRFQRWLVGGSEVRQLALPEPLAKSLLPAGSQLERRRARERSGYPVGYRHELLSLAMVEQQPNTIEPDLDRDLVLHLVASHHGYCRPFAPALDDPDDIDVGLNHGIDRLGASTRHQKSRLDSGVSDRFWILVERYGPWGLAWLEAVMRLADHRASEMEANEELP